MERRVSFVSHPFADTLHYARIRSSLPDVEREVANPRFWWKAVPQGRGRTCPLTRETLPPAA
jgi:hypothetical protein